MEVEDAAVRERAPSGTWIEALGGSRQPDVDGAIRVPLRRAQLELLARAGRGTLAQLLGAAALPVDRLSRTIGFARPTILFREILPNVMPVLIALLTLEMGIAVVVEAILSFVGLSVSSDTPTWGGMIAEGRQIVHEAWWVLAAPLAALFATVVAFNQLGDGLARSLDPVLRR